VWLACLAAGALAALGHLAAAGPRRRREIRAADRGEDVARRCPGDRLVPFRRVVRREVLVDAQVPW
jgi:hypothetical protein